MEQTGRTGRAGEKPFRPDVQTAQAPVSVEEAKDAYANEGNAPDEQAAMAQSGMAAHDCAALHLLVRINDDAGRFYRHAAAAGGELAQDFVELAELHESTAMTLAERMNAIGVAPPEDSVMESHKFFSALKIELAQGVSCNLLERLEDAEDDTLRALEDALEKGITVDTQAFLAEQMILLEKARDRVKHLKSCLRADD